MPVGKVEGEFKRLQQSSGLTDACKSFIGELKHVLATLSMVRGRPSISRKVTKLIFDKFAESELPCQIQGQQKLIRGRSGEKIAVGSTRHSGHSLVGAATDAHTVTGKPKMTHFSARVLTISAEHGFIVGTVMVPNEGQEHAVAAVEALYGGPQRDGPLHELIHANLRLGGHLQKFPKVICTDFVSRDLDFRQRAAERVTEGSLENGAAIRTPSGLLTITG